MTESETDKQLETRLAEALARGDAAAVEALASARKALAEAATQRNQAQDRRSQKRRETITTVITTFASGIVPLLTLFTLYVTVRMQNQQLDLSREAAEDTAWREMIGHYAHGTATDEEGIATSAELESFFHSSRYADQARGMAMLLLPRIGDPVGFRDLFNSAIDTPNWARFQDVVKVNQEVAYDLAMSRDCLDHWEECRRRPSGGPSGPGAAPTREIVSQHIDVLLDNIRATSDALAKILKTPPPAGQKVDLTKTYFYKADLSGAHLAGATIAGATFDRCDMSGAHLRGVTGWESSSWWWSDWWWAADIDPELLIPLTSCCYPFRDGTDSYVHAVDSAKYAEQVTKLLQEAAKRHHGAAEGGASDAGPLDASALPFGYDAGSEAESPSTLVAVPEAGVPEGGLTVSFRIGDRVRLRSGGTVMTVEQVLDGATRYKTTWFSLNNRQENTFARETLELAPAYPLPQPPPPP